MTKIGKLFEPEKEKALKNVIHTVIKENAEHNKKRDCDEIGEKNIPQSKKPVL